MGGRARRPILWVHGVATTKEQPDVVLVPLDSDLAPEPARRRRVVGTSDFDAAIEMHGAPPMLVVAKGLQRQGQQRWSFFGKHGRDLPFGGAVNAGISPALLPLIQIGLRFFQTFEALPF